MTTEATPKHRAYIERERDGFIVLCTDGDCRRGSSAPTVLELVPDKERAEEIRKAHGAEVSAAP